MFDLLRKGNIQNDNSKINIEMLLISFAFFKANIVRLLASDLMNVLNKDEFVTWLYMENDKYFIFTPL